LIVGGDRLATCFFFCRDIAEKAYWTLIIRFGSILILHRAFLKLTGEVADIRKFNWKISQNSEKVLSLLLHSKWKCFSWFDSYVWYWESILYWKVMFAKVI
jgi:hypothetical protein